MANGKAFTPEYRQGGGPLAPGQRETVSGVSESGHYAWLDRPVAPKRLRRIWVAGEIADIHKASGGTYGARRAGAELKYGRGTIARHNKIKGRSDEAATERTPGPQRSLA